MAEPGGPWKWVIEPAGHAGCFDLVTRARAGSRNKIGMLGAP